MKSLFKFSLILIFLTIPLSANAKVLELFLQPQVGGVIGLYNQNKFPWGDEERDLAGAEEDYFVVHQGGTYGFSAGLEFLFIDMVFEMNQTIKPGGISSTYVAWMLGFDADFQLSEVSEFTMYLFAGVALGTANDDWLKEEKPQINHDDLYAQIILARLGARYEYKFTKNIRLSIDGGIGVHVTQISQKPANSDGAQTSGVHAYGTIGIRIYFDVFGDDKNPKK
jgi:hypothetical protein